MKTSIAILSIAAALVAGGTTGAVAAGSAGARESIVAAMGDTISPRFAIRTDSVLKVVGTRIYVAKCGQGMIFLRTMRAGVFITADTITVDVASGCTPILPDLKPTSITICTRPHPDSMAKYKVRSDTSIDPNLIPCLDPQ